MRLRRRSLWVWPSFLVAVVVGLFPDQAHAQVTWEVDRKFSIAWWQMSPHLGSLWATTCPQDPSWRPEHGTTYVDAEDTVHIPLHLRHEVSTPCPGAVDGQIEIPDTVSWRGAHGLVRVAVDSLLMGTPLRDRYVRTTVLQTNVFAYALFKIDSLVGMTHHGDTLVGTAVGVVTIRNRNNPITAAVRAWPEAGGMRVLARMRTQAIALIEEFGMSENALSFGIESNVWKDFFMGVDLVLRPAAPPAN